MTNLFLLANEMNLEDATPSYHLHVHSVGKVIWSVRVSAFIGTNIKFKRVSKTVLDSSKPTYT